MIKLKLFTFLSISKIVLMAQLPNSDLWLFSIKPSKENIELKNPLNINNREGYDNQPSFSEDGKKLFYVSIKEDKQSDIYFYDIKKKQNIRFTNTTESEYSPTQSPNSELISTVIVEKDSAQRIHLLNGKSAHDDGKFEMDSVGYFSYLNTDTLVYYKLTDPHTLKVFIKSNQTDFLICQSPIRGFKAINRHCLLYGIKDSLFTTYFKYDFLLGRAYRYAQSSAQSEDLVWHPIFGLLISDKANILKYIPETSSWQVLFDLSPFGIKKITRFAFDNKTNYLVVVNNL